jgi:hypothetical protein
VDDVHSGGHIDGNGGVVGVVVKASGGHGRTSKNNKKILYRFSSPSVTQTLLEMSMLRSDRHVDDVDGGHHVEVGVGVLPNRKRRRCYSGL